MRIQAIAQPKAMQAQDMAEFEGRGRVQAVFVGVISGACLSGGGARSCGFFPWLARAGDLRLFFFCFCRPSGHFV